MDCAQEIGVSVRTLEEVGETQYQQFKKADRENSWLERAYQREQTRDSSSPPQASM
jgi:hypothetical protein